MKNSPKYLVPALLALAMISCGAPNTPESSAPSVESQASTPSVPSTTSSVSSSEPSVVPSSEPSSEPSVAPSSDPSVEPSSEPSIPSSDPSSEPSSIIPSKKDWNEDGVLKILEIGNSYGEDTFQYAPDVLKALGVNNFVLGKMYIGGSSIEDHYNNIQSDTRTRGSYEYRKIYDSTVPNWALMEKTSVLFAINDEEWDFISIQQQSMRSTEPESYSHLNDVLDFIDTNNSYKDSKYVYNMTWAYPENNPDEKYTGTYHSNTLEMYADIISTVKSTIIPNERFDKVLVPGTAAENARTSFLKKKLFRDDLHLSYDKGRYIAGMTYFSELVDRELTEDFPYAPASLTPNEKAACVESARNALAHKYEVTNSIYPTDPTVRFDGTDKTVRLEAEDGVLDGIKAKRIGCENASGGYFAADINDCGQGLEWVHYAPVAGEHEIEIAYWTANAGSKNTIYVNGVKSGEVVYNEAGTWANGFNESLKVRTTITLKQGFNTISLFKRGTASDSPAWGGWTQIDYVDIIGTNATYDPASLDLSAPSFQLEAEYGYFHTGGLPFDCDTMSGNYAVGEINETGHGVDLYFRAPVDGRYGLKIVYAQGSSGNKANVFLNEESTVHELAPYSGQAWNKTNVSDVVIESELSSENLNYVSIARANSSAGWFIIDAIVLVPLA